MSEMPDIEDSKPIEELGWTKEQALAMRRRLSTFAEFWDDDEEDEVTYTNPGAKA